MIRFNHISILFLSILVAGCTSDLKDEKIPASSETADTQTEEYVPGTANVYFTEEVAEMLESSDDDVFDEDGPYEVIQINEDFETDKNVIKRDIFKP